MIRIINGDDGVVGDNIIHGGGRFTDLDNFPLKHVVGKRVHGEFSRLAGFHLANVRLGNAGINVHLCQVVGDGKQHRRIERRRDRLADIELARNNNAINRRINRAVVQVRPRIFQRRRPDFNIRLGLMQAGNGLIIVGL